MYRNISKQWHKGSYKAEEYAPPLRVWSPSRHKGSYMTEVNTTLLPLPLTCLEPIASPMRLRKRMYCAHTSEPWSCGNVSLGGAAFPVGSEPPPAATSDSISSIRPSYTFR